MKPKRRPLMVDDFLAHFPFSKPVYISKKQAHQLRDALLVSHRYVFDASAARTLVEFLKEMPDALIDSIEFAIPPYASTYIEIPGFDEVWRALNPSVEELEFPDTHVGFLYHNGRIYTLANSTHTSSIWHPVVSPMVYTLHKEWPVEEQIRIAEYMHVSRVQLDMHMLGATYMSMSPEKRGLMREHVRIDPLDGLDVKNSEAWKQYSHSSAGDLRTSLACLLLLNRTHATHYTKDIGPARGMVGNKAGTYLAYSEVRFDLTPGEVVRRIRDSYTSSETRESLARRMHGVRGHFVVRSKDAVRAGRTVCGAHNHMWKEDTEAHEDKRIRYRCGACKATMYWRREHTRGSAEHGEVTTVTHVTSN